MLNAKGMLVVYDFSAGRSFAGDGDYSLDTWFGEFMARYQQPAGEARQLNPDILGSLAVESGSFVLGRHMNFEIPILLDPEFYLEYMLTETNVAAAVRGGISLESIRRWCRETLAPVWNGRPRKVLFRGYFACLVNS